MSTLQPRRAANPAAGPQLPDAGPAETRRKFVAWLIFVGMIAAINYASNIVAAGKTDVDALYQYSTAVGETVLYAVMLGIVLWITGHRRDLLALARPASWFRSMGLAAAAFAVTLFIVQLLLEPLFHGGREQGVVPTHWEPAHAGAYAANWIVLAGIDPIVEELTYRGLGFSLLSARFGKWVSIVGIGLLFAAGHGLFQAFPELAVLGCALAWLRWKTGSVYPGMAVHALFNSVALALVIATK